VHESNCKANRWSQGANRKTVSSYIVKRIADSLLETPFRVAILFLLFPALSFSQVYKVHGKVYDARNNHPLSFADVTIVDTSYGTSSNAEGKYVLKLSPGFYKLRAGYLGYFSDTVHITIDSADIERDIFLNPAEIFTEEILVLGEDPAYDIIRKAILNKKTFRSKLRNYEYDAYSKWLFRYGQKKDTVDKDKLEILGILETEAKGYVKPPDREKIIVKSKRETANIGEGIALPIIVNFYDEEIRINEVSIRTPLADEPFDDYEYRLLWITSIDSTRVFKIRVTNKSDNIPLFFGDIYIADSSFSLVRVDLKTNDAARIRAIDQLHLIQKFRLYRDSQKEKYWMPDDIQMYGDGNFGGLVKFQVELYSIIFDYKINSEIPKGIFDDYIVKVAPDAEKDSSYWKENQFIRYTEEEDRAYAKIKSEEEKKSRKLRIGTSGMRVGNFSTKVLDYIDFNRVQGTYIQPNLSYQNETSSTKLEGFIGYGFSDKKTHYGVGFEQSFLKNNRLTLSAGFYKKLHALSYPLSGFNRSWNMTSCLFQKVDYYDYYYSSGYNINLRYKFSSQLKVTLKYEQEKQTSAVKTTDYSFLKRNQNFRENPSITDGFVRAVGFNLEINPNKFRFIDLGDKVWEFAVTNYPIISAGFEYSNKNFMKSRFEYGKYFIQVNGDYGLNYFLNFRYRLGSMILSGDVPFQKLAHFDIAVPGFNSPLAFRSMGYQEFLGDRIYYFNFENNFGKVIWGSIPFLKKFNLIGFANFAKNDGIRKINGTFIETGFGIGGILDLFRLDFGWRLTNRVAGKNFRLVIVLE